MDPNAAIDDMRSAISAFDGAEDMQEAMAAADRLVSIVSGLDSWLSSGGFMPDAWKEALGERHWQSVLESTNRRSAERMKAACRQALMQLPQEERSGGWVSISRDRAIAAVADVKVTL